MLKKLILWDIDGTLLDTSHAGVRAFSRAFGQHFKITSDLSEIDFRGATDWRIFNELCRHHNLPSSDEARNSFFNAYFPILAQELQKGAVRLHPGVASLLEKLAAHPGFTQGLLTGNMPAAAQLKLEAAAIWHYFPFGAFGSDAADRNALGPVALKRAKQHAGSSFAPADIFIIGDTPHDIACARVIGAQAIAVATGGHSLDSLAVHNPDHLLPDLSDTKKLLSLLDAG